jgi:hypothetical protein
MLFFENEQLVARSQIPPHFDSPRVTIKYVRSHLSHLEADRNSQTEDTSCCDDSLVTKSFNGFMSHTVQCTVYTNGGPLIPHIVVL